MKYAMVKLGMIAAGSVLCSLAAVPAQAIPGYGAYALTSVRPCSPIGSPIIGSDQDCGGSKPANFGLGGAPGMSSASASSAPSNPIYAGAHSTASATLDPKNFGLPVLHGASISAGNDSRTNASPGAYQSFIYTGSAPVAYGLAGTLTFEDSSASPSDYKLPGGAAYGAYIGIFDADFFPHWATQDDIFNSAINGFNPCGAPGLLAMGLTSGTAPGGAFSASVSTSACGGGQLMLKPGHEYVALALVEAFANRGGFLDYSNTFTVDLDPNLGSATLNDLSQHLVWGVDAVPEPSAWALMLAGLAGTGALLRRSRRRERLRAA